MSTHEKPFNEQSTELFLKNAVEKIVSAYHQEKILLFGSYAYGTTNKNSDLDLFIILESSERPAQRRIKMELLFLDRKVLMDFIVKTPAEVAERLRIGDFFIKKNLDKRESAL